MLIKAPLWLRAWRDPVCSAGNKFEVAKDGVIKLGSIGQSSDDRPWAMAASSSSSSSANEGKKTLVKRLDGTVEEVVTGLPPSNPAFAPRAAWPGGKIVTNDKLEVKLRFYERKGIALTPELEAKVRIL